MSNICQKLDIDSSEFGLTVRGINGGFIPVSAEDTINHARRIVSIIRVKNYDG